MSQQQFLGTWKLVSAEFRRPDGTAIEYLGDNPMGMLIYTSDGHMSVHLVQRDRPRFVTDDRMGGTPEQISAAYLGYQGYFGTFTVNETERMVTHHIQASSFPNWVGVDQRRFFELAGDRLTLRTPPLLIGKAQVVGHLVWQRTRKSENGTGET